MRVRGRHRTEPGACLLPVTPRPRNPRAVHSVRTQSCASNTQRPSRGRALSPAARPVQRPRLSQQMHRPGQGLAAATPQPRASGPRRLRDPSGALPPPPTVPTAGCPLDRRSQLTRAPSALFPELGGPLSL